MSATNCGMCSKSLPVLFGKKESVGGDLFCADCAPKAKAILERRKAALKSGVSHVQVLTVDCPAGATVSKHLGIVSGRSVQALGPISELFAGITDFVGGSLSGVGARFAAAEADAIRQIQLETVILGGNVVVGSKIDYEFSDGHNGRSVLVLVFGTAAIITSPA